MLRKPTAPYFTTSPCASVLFSIGSSIKRVLRARSVQAYLVLTTAALLAVLPWRKNGRCLTMSAAARPRCAKRGAFLSPREYLAKFEGLIRNGPERRSAAAVAQAEARVRYEMTLSAAAIREANKRLQDPIRIRLSMDIDDHGVARPCARCSLHRNTAFAKARDRCTQRDQDFCHTCLRQHAALCRWPGTASTEGMKAAADDSTAFESSDVSDSEADFSDISVE